MQDLPRYDRNRTYQWNYENAPTEPPDVAIAEMPGEWTYSGLPVNSPLGIAAGPLLNGKWIQYYAALGFDVLTYKTVRSHSRECYPLPNLLPVSTRTMAGDEDSVESTEVLDGSWAVSFGMPSAEPELWREDIRLTKQAMKPGQLLSVSVVGTMQPGWSIQDLAEDYAQCGQWAVDSGADCIEMNFSCPNVCSEDGQLYISPNDAEVVAGTAREKVGTGVPLLVKIGFVPSNGTLNDLLKALAPHVDSVVMMNSIPSRVRGSDGQFLFGDEQRGICGKATLRASVEQVARCRQVIETNRLPLTVIGVGGIDCWEDVQKYLDAGAEAVQLATAVMLDPGVGMEIRDEFQHVSSR